MPVTGTTTIHCRSLTWNPFYCFRIFPKDFSPFVRFMFYLFIFYFYFFFFFLLFCESTHYEKQKKQQHKNNKNLQTGHGNTLLCRSFFFKLSREKSVKSLCYQKIYIKVYLMHKTNHGTLTAFQDKHRTTQALVGPSHFWPHTSLVTSLVYNSASARQTARLS